jgi:hypothetical protein
VAKDQMIIVYNGYGYYSNRLFQNLHFEAFCLENSIPYINPTFADIADYYISPSNLGISKMVRLLKPKITKYLIKTGLLGRTITFKDKHSDNVSMLLQQAQHDPLQDIYVDGWGFRVHDLTAKYQDLFIAKYTLKETFYLHNPIFQLQLSVDRQTTALVGVHVRRGDYRTWQGGQYFFDDQVYIDNMLDLEAKIAAAYAKNTVFIIFSNEPINLRKMSPHYPTNSYISENAWYVDHLLMSQCDFLIGPPSTFTLWASYMGKTKFLHITDKSGVINLDAFTLCLG